MGRKGGDEEGGRFDTRKRDDKDVTFSSACPFFFFLIFELNLYLEKIFYTSFLCSPFKKETLYIIYTQTTIEKYFTSKYMNSDVT